MVNKRSNLVKVMRPSRLRREALGFPGVRIEGPASSAAGRAMGCDDSLPPNQQPSLVSDVGADHVYKDGTVPQAGRAGRSSVSLGPPGLGLYCAEGEALEI